MRVNVFAMKKTNQLDNETNNSAIITNKKVNESQHCYITSQYYEMFTNDYLNS